MTWKVGNKISIVNYPNYSFHHTLKGGVMGPVWGGYLKHLGTGALFLAAICTYGFSLTVNQSATGLSVTVETSGAYSVAAAAPAWTFGGNLSKTLSEVTQTDGSDKIGKFTGITFTLTGTGPLQGTIRLYERIPVAIFSMKTLAQMANMGVTFPQFTSYPNTNMLYLGQVNNVFTPVTHALASIGDQSALIAYNTQSETYCFSPIDHFWEVSNLYSGSLRSTIKSWASPLPSGWDHQVILAVGKGINATCDAWGEGLRGYWGKPLPSNQADLAMNKLGFWMDNISYYYYRVDGGYANYEAQTVAIVDYWKNTVKIPLSYLQLDSWWYIKGCNQGWNSSSAGCYIYKAHSQVFPTGLTGLHNKVKIPFVTHHRWYEASCSPIATKYGLSGGLPIKYTAWKEIISGVADTGSICFEQDWLQHTAQVAQHIGDLDSALGNMARVCAEKKITQQYCMTGPMHYLQAAKYPTVNSIRTTDDGYRQAVWNWHILNSRLCWSVGVFPWVDCFKSSSKGCVVSAVMAATYFPPSDKMGAENMTNLLPALRRDGVLVHPDIPGLPTENTFINMARGTAANPIQRTWTDHGNNLKTWYIWVPGANASNYTFDLAQEGVNAPNGAYAYEWLTKKGKTVTSGGQLTDACAYGTEAFDYWILAPIAPCGIAFLGDLSKYTSCGRSRVTALTHSATQVLATIDLETQESSVTLSGYATAKPNAVCSDNATIGAVNFSNNMFTVVLTPKAGARTPMNVAFGSDPTVGARRTAPSFLQASSITVSTSQGRITADMGRLSDFTVQVFTLTGRLMQSALCRNRSSWTSTGERFEAGTYLIRIATPEASYVKKCLVR
jgi:hypothetical protein